MVLYPIARIHRSGNQGVVLGVASLVTTPSNMLTIFLFPVPTVLYSAGLEVLVPKAGIFPPGDTIMILSNWELRLSSGHFGLLMPLNEQA